MSIRNYPRFRSDSPIGRGRIALAIRVRGYGLTIDLSPSSQPSPMGEGAHFRCLSVLRFLTLLGLAREVLEQFLDLAVLLALAVGPFADHLLFGPHMRDQTLNGFGEIGHRGGSATAPAAFIERQPQSLDGRLEFAA